MIFIFSCILDGTVTFDRLMYDVDEREEIVQLILLISNPSPTPFTVQMIITDGSATGRHYTTTV